MNKSFTTVIVGAVALLLAGCESTGVEARIQEKATVFNSLPAGAQERIRNGLIEAGYTADMVYIALGKPSKVETAANGQAEIWTYKNFLPPAATYQTQVDSVATGTPNTTATRVSSSESTNTRSLSDTRGGPQTSLSIGDLPFDTLFVTFRDGKVTGSRLQSQSK